MRVWGGGGGWMKIKVVQLTCYTRVGLIFGLGSILLTGP